MSERKVGVVAEMLAWFRPSVVPLPKCGNPFLVDVGYPWAMVAAWNESNNDVVMAEFHVGMYHGKNDPAFENEWEKEEAVLRWMPLPPVVSVKTAAAELQGIEEDHWC